MFPRINRAILPLLFKLDFSACARARARMTDYNGVNANPLAVARKVVRVNEVLAVGNVIIESVEGTLSRLGGQPFSLFLFYFFLFYFFPLFFI